VCKYLLKPSFGIPKSLRKVPEKSSVRGTETEEDVSKVNLSSGELNI
jgi:hypothetical protein